MPGHSGPVRRGEEMHKGGIIRSLGQYPVIEKGAHTQLGMANFAFTLEELPERFSEKLSGHDLKIWLVTHPATATKRLEVAAYDMAPNGLDRGELIKVFTIKGKLRDQMRNAGLVVDAAGAAAADAAAAVNAADAGPSAAGANA